VVPLVVLVLVLLLFGIISAVSTSTLIYIMNKKKKNRMLTKQSQESQAPREKVSAIEVGSGHHSAQSETGFSSTSKTNTITSRATASGSKGIVSKIQSAPSSQTHLKFIGLKSGDKQPTEITTPPKLDSDATPSGLDQPGRFTPRKTSLKKAATSEAKASEEEESAGFRSRRGSCSVKSRSGSLPSHVMSNDRYTSQSGRSARDKLNSAGSSLRKMQELTKGRRLQSKESSVDLMPGTSAPRPHFSTRGPSGPKCMCHPGHMMDHTYSNINQPTSNTAECTCHPGQKMDPVYDNINNQAASNTNDCMCLPGQKMASPIYDNIKQPAAGAEKKQEITRGGTGKNPGAPLTLSK